MVLPATDNFNRADGPVGANWTLDHGTGSLQVATNEVTGGDASGQGMHWNADAFTGDHYGEMIARNDNADGGPSVRGGSSDSYLLDNFGTLLTIYQYNGGLFDVVASQTKDYSAGSVYRLEVSGSSLTSKEDGSTTGMPSGTDSSLTGGAPGIFSTNGWLGDDWQGDDLGGGGPVVPALDEGMLVGGMQPLAGGVH